MSVQSRRWCSVHGNTQQWGSKCGRMMWMGATVEHIWGRPTWPPSIFKGNSGLLRLVIMILLSWGSEYATSGFSYRASACKKCHFIVNFRLFMGLLTLNVKLNDRNKKCTVLAATISLNYWVSIKCTILPPSDNIIRYLFSVFVSGDSLTHTELTSQRVLIHHANAKDYLIHITSKNRGGRMDTARA